MLAPFIFCLFNSISSDGYLCSLIAEEMLLLHTWVVQGGLGSRGLLVPWTGVNPLVFCLISQEGPRNQDPCEECIATFHKI